MSYTPTLVINKRSLENKRAEIESGVYAYDYASERVCELLLDVLNNFEYGSDDEDMRFPY